MSAQRPADHATEADRASVRLRGHHLICLQFFRGEGYSPEFVENLARVIAGATEGAALVVAGADDVCAACPGLASDGTCGDPDAGEAEVQRLDALALSLLDVSPGERVSLAESRARLSVNRDAIARWCIEACTGCAWEKVCDEGWAELLAEGPVSEDVSDEGGSGRP